MKLLIMKIIINTKMEVIINITTTTTTITTTAVTITASHRKGNETKLKINKHK